MGNASAVGSLGRLNSDVSNGSPQFPIRSITEFLRNPIVSVPATRLTFEDEKSMAPNLRPRRVLQDSRLSQIQRNRRSRVSIKDSDKIFAN